jgi:predicted secreted protein
MGITSGLVLFAVIWFMTFLCVIPVRLKTQGDMGEVVPGTHESSPERHNLKLKALITTGISLVLWAVFAWIIIGGLITVDDIERWTYGEDGLRSLSN